MVAGSRSTPLRVLVVDDDEPNRLLAIEVLTLFGVDALAVSTASAALCALEQRQIDLVFTDVQMPEMTGLELADAIRAFEKRTGGPRLPIVALTANAMAHQRAECLQHGIDEVLTKPFDFDLLKATLARWGHVTPF